MPKGFLPVSDSGLLAWTINFNALIDAAPTVYGLTVEQAAEYTTLSNAYAVAYQTAVDPGTRTKGKVAAKNTARAALKDRARLLAKVIEGQPTVTDEQKIDLGLNVRKAQSPIPVPDSAPDIDIVSVSGRRVKIRLHNADNTKRGKPAGVAGASVFSFIGEVPPSDTAAWKFEGNTTRTVVDVDIDPAAQPGAKVWLTSFWFNPRAQSGPAANPVTTNVQFGVESTTSTIKLAA